MCPEIVLIVVVLFLCFAIRNVFSPLIRDRPTQTNGSNHIYKVSSAKSKQKYHFPQLLIEKNLLCNNRILKNSYRMTDCRYMPV